MPKLSTRKSLVKKLDRVFSEYIRQRDRRCVNCGTTEKLTAGHVFSRVAYSTRWDERNCFAQCWSHNFAHEYDPFPLTEHARAVLGDEGYKQLHRDYLTPRKFTDRELLELIETYK